jgi:GalNAc5-diNAcBac-PP-undecaprenol beta-1,3-glucosyltransferase
MDRKPLFSIITATYNRAHLLPRAVNSILNQSYQNFELIIVDDGSTDDTEKVARSFEDKRVLYHKHEQNRGMLAARNTGFDIARGDYVTLLDDDDELLPEALQTAVENLTELSSKGVKILLFDRLDVERKERSGYGIEEEGYIDYEDILCERVFRDFWWVIERDLIGDNERFDERLWGDEVILWLRLLRKSRAFYVPKVLYMNYRQHGERVSDYANRLKNATRCALTHSAFIAEYGNEMKRICPKPYGRRLAALGALQILDGQKREGRRACLESLKYYVSPGTCIVFLLSFILSGNQIKSLALSYMKILDMKPRLQRSAKTILGRYYSRFLRRHP